MNRTAFVIEPGRRSKALHVVGERITVLAAGDTTGGYEIFLQEGPEGSGPPPHSHAWDESFYITQGQVEFGIGDQQHAAGVGTLVHLPGGTVHWFRFGAGGGQMISMTSRHAASSMFAHIDREIAPADPDFARLAAIAALHGTELAVTV